MVAPPPVKAGMVSAPPSTSASAPLGSAWRPKAEGGDDRPRLLTRTEKRFGRFDGRDEPSGTSLFDEGASQHRVSRAVPVACSHRTLNRAHIAAWSLHRFVIQSSK